MENTRARPRTLEQFLQTRSRCSGSLGSVPLVGGANVRHPAVASLKKRFFLLFFRSPSAMVMTTPTAGVAVVRTCARAAPSAASAGAYDCLV